jgi:hypothetical protein
LGKKKSCHEDTKTLRKAKGRRQIAKKKKKNIATKSQRHKVRQRAKGRKQKGQREISPRRHEDTKKGKGQKAEGRNEKGEASIYIIPSSRRRGLRGGVLSNHPFIPSFKRRECYFFGSFYS